MNRPQELKEYQSVFFSITIPQADSNRLDKSTTLGALDREKEL